MLTKLPGIKIRSGHFSLRESNAAAERHTDRQKSCHLWGSVMVEDLLQSLAKVS